MRFEAKHAFFKQVVRDRKNFKNTPKMLATKLQLHQCYVDASGKLFRRHGLEVQSGNYVPLSFFQQFQTVIALKIPGVETVLNFERCPYNGVLYQSGLCVLCSFNCGLPQFCKI